MPVPRFDDLEMDFSAAVDAAEGPIPVLRRLANFAFSVRTIRAGGRRGMAQGLVLEAGL